MIQVWNILSSVERTCPLLLGTWSLLLSLVPSTTAPEMEKYLRSVGHKRLTAVGPTAFPRVLYQQKGFPKAGTQQGLTAGSSSAACTGHNQQEICSVRHWLPLLHLQGGCWLWGMKQKWFECRSETGELFQAPLVHWSGACCLEHHFYLLLKWGWKEGALFSSGDSSALWLISQREGRLSA